MLFAASESPPTVFEALNNFIADTMKTFNLKKFRSGRGLTLKEIALKTGIPPIHLSEIERGLRPISAIHLEKIKIAFPQAAQYHEKEKEKTFRILHKSQIVEQ